MVATKTIETHTRTHRETASMPALQVEPQVRKIKSPDNINTKKWGAKKLVTYILGETLKNLNQIEGRFGTKTTESIGINEAQLDLSKLTNFFLHVINQFMIRKFGDENANRFGHEIQKIVVVESMLAFSSAIPRTPEEVLTNLGSRLEVKRQEAVNSKNEPVALIFTALLWSVRGITGEKRKKFNSHITKEAKTTH